jgi:phenylacetate-CoA ligase
VHRWLVWNVLFPLQERLKKHPTMRFLADMERAESLDRAGLEKLRAAKLRAVLEYGFANVPYVQRIFREAGITPSKIQTPADLTPLPVIRKPELRRERQNLRSRLAGKLTPFSTGGSSGEPLLFDLPRERIASWIACRQRAMRWFGLSVGSREFALWGSPVEVTRQDRLREVRDRVFATQLLSAFDMSEAVMSRYLGLVARRGCDTIFSYPSSIYLLCQYARKTGVDLRAAGVKTVFVTGEVLLPEQRTVISETFDCPVANGYGGREMGFIAHECPRGGMHIMADATIVEILHEDGTPVPAGEAGEIVVTDLYSREVPFIRYATGDIGILSQRSCPCGRPLPLFERIEGRTTDFIVGADGTVLHALSVIYILREIDGIEQFRIHQRALDRFHVQLVKNRNYTDESNDRIRDGFCKRLRSQVEVTIEHVPHMAAERSGKFRYVVSEVPFPAGLPVRSS